MQFQRLKRPTSEAIRTTVRSFENYRDHCIEVQTSSINGAAMTVAIFVDGTQCLKKSITSSNEAAMHKRGMKLGMDLIDTLEAERDPMAIRAAPASFRHDGDKAAAVRTSV